MKGAWRTVLNALGINLLLIFLLILFIRLIHIFFVCL